MKIINNVAILEIITPQGIINPVLIWDNTNTILIDTGFPSQLDLFRDEILKAGFSLKDINKIIITHHDMDHIGCAKEFANLGAEVLAHEEEAPYIQGDKTALKLVAMEERLDELSEGERLFYEHVKAGAPKFHVRVDRRLKDKEVLPFGGGIEVIHTPGHTHGHISLFLKESGILITGDAANVINGKLSGPNPQFSYDIKQAQVSFEKLKGFKSKYIVCYHGGIYSF